MQLLIPRKIYKTTNSDSITDTISIPALSSGTLFSLSDSSIKFISGFCYISSNINEASFRFELTKLSSTTKLIVYSITGYEFNLSFNDYLNSDNGLSLDIINNENYTIVVDINYKTIF